MRSFQVSTTSGSSGRTTSSSACSKLLTTPSVRVYLRLFLSQRTPPADYIPTSTFTGQTMMSELTPPGFENMFFGLFGLSNRASSIIGPNVIQAIIDDANGNNWMGFPFLFAMAAAASLVIWFGVNVEKGRKDAVAFAQQRVAQRRVAEGEIGAGREVETSQDGSIAKVD